MWPWGNSRPGRDEFVRTNLTVDALRVEAKDAVFWDRCLRGFGVRVYPSGRRVYTVQIRGPAGSKRATLGLHGPLSADQAHRQEATVADRIKRSADLLPPPLAQLEPEPTVAIS